VELSGSSAFDRDDDIVVNAYLLKRPDEPFKLVQYFLLVPE